jgi:hypothetical protein
VLTSVSALFVPALQWRRQHRPLLPDVGVEPLCDFELANEWSGMPANPGNRKRPSDCRPWRTPEDQVDFGSPDWSVV